MVSILLPVSTILSALMIDDEVAGVHMGGVLRLVLALEDLGDFTGEPTEHLIGGIDEQPLALDFAWLGVIGLQWSSNLLVITVFAEFTGLKRTL